MLTKIKHHIAKMLADAADISEEKTFSSLELPKNEFGDLTSKIAFVLASEQKKNPMEIANSIVVKLPKDEYVAKVETKGPYINFYLSDKFYSEQANEIVKLKDKFGIGKKTNKKVMIEYFHANTHKGVHIGHIRNISIGEALARTLEFAGNKVIRANFQGDIGMHVAKCLWGFINIYHEKAPEENRGVWLGKVYSEASGMTKGNEELETQVKDINVKLYTGDKKLTALLKKTRQWCLDDFKEFYKEFGVTFDELYFESETEKIGTKIVMEALKKGIAKEDQGAIIMDLKDDGLGVYVLITKEGYPLYSTKDIGLAKIKFDKYKLDRSIHLVGKEQEFHFMQLFKAFEKLGMEKAAKVSYHLIYDLVMLPEGKMSSREGTMVLYEDLKTKLMELTRVEVKKRHEDWDAKQVEETARKIAFAALKFSMVRKENNRIIVFDWNEALNLEGDSGPYLQYAYVRTNGILEGYKTSRDVANKLVVQSNKMSTQLSSATMRTLFETSNNCVVALQQSEGHTDIEKAGKKEINVKGYSYTNEEKKLVKLLSEFPEVIERTASHLSTNTLAQYLLEVASFFNKFYASSPVLNAEKEDERNARLEIVKATNTVLKSGLSLLGIECPEKM
ncbi:MAG: arginine--tRNA ligase [Candidatus Micrarchaeota archaeon]|nr:arginine--tRNA ligase [Candidatus Micrarchaeota archaeon]